MDNFSITQFGKPLDRDKYSIDLDTKTFTSKANELALDFRCLAGWSFTTGSCCTFNTGMNCIFKTGLGCNFTTHTFCTFDTGIDCTFTTGGNCTFRGNTEELALNDNCIFNTGNYCKFITNTHCTFKTGHDCTFDTEESCTFMVMYIKTCKFKSCDGVSIILDRDDDKHYILTKELINMIKVMNG